MNSPSLFRLSIIIGRTVRLPLPDNEMLSPPDGGVVFGLIPAKKFKGFELKFSPPKNRGLETLPNSLLDLSHRLVSSSGSPPGLMLRFRTLSASIVLKEKFPLPFY